MRGTAPLVASCRWLKLRRGRRYIIPGLIWFAAVALFIAVWIYVILQTDG
jgi:hypothetical protein